MLLLNLGPAGDSFAGAFGGIAALLIIGGPIALRWQRNRQQFALAQAALVQGVTHFSKGQPIWLVSFRQGLSALTLGVALLLVGAAGCWFTSNLKTPGVATTQIAASVAAVTTLPVNVSSPVGLAEGRGAGRFGPLQPNPEMDEWHRLKAINTLGLMSLATGFILTLLGIMRIAFVSVERRHHTDDLLP